MFNNWGDVSSENIRLPYLYVEPRWGINTEWGRCYRWTRHMGQDMYPNIGDVNISPCTFLLDGPHPLIFSTKYFLLFILNKVLYNAFYKLLYMFVHLCIYLNLFCNFQWFVLLISDRTWWSTLQRNQLFC